jgi:hypothetical protein
LKVFDSNAVIRFFALNHSMKYLVNKLTFNSMQLNLVLKVPRLGVSVCLNI